MSEDLERQLESARFRRTLLGYAPREVDALLEKATQALKRLEQEKKHLEQVVAGYRAQEENLRAALLRAEETARRAREEAKHEATVLRAEAQVEARRLLAEAQEEYRRLEEERKRYQEALKEKVGGYEREMQVLLDRFYVVVRRHLRFIEEEFSQEVKKVLERFEQELRELPAPAATLEAKGSGCPEAAATKGEKDKDLPEAPLFLGRQLREDLRDETGKVVVTAGEVITPEVLERAMAHGVYGELISRLAEEEVERLKGEKR